jgi:hypothetical protein
VLKLGVSIGAVEGRDALVSADGIAGLGWPGNGKGRQGGGEHDEGLAHANSISLIDRGARSYRKIGRLAP